MNRNHSSYKQDETPCWVYVLSSGTGSFRMGCAPTPPGPETEARYGMRLVWQKCFRGVANGIAYKLMLENISPGSLKHIIRNVPSQPEPEY